LFYPDCLHKIIATKQFEWPHILFFKLIPKKYFFQPLSFMKTLAAAAAAAAALSPAIVAAADSAEKPPP
jgi:hypothetical protein